MANVLDDLAVHIGTLLPDETIFKGFMPDGADVADRLIALVMTEPGLEILDTMGTSIGTIGIERPIVQIFTRDASDDFQASFDLAVEVYQAIHNTVNTTINGTFYYMLEAIQYPYSISRDQNARWLSGFNLQVHKEPNS